MWLSLRFQVAWLGEIEQQGSVFFCSILPWFSEKVTYRCMPRGVEGNPVPLVTALVVQ